ncbi:MAG: GGDEF domain-containing protein [Gammaproteobacteria bacterium]
MDQPLWLAMFSQTASRVVGSVSHDVTQKRMTPLMVGAPRQASIGLNFPEPLESRFRRFYSQSNAIRARIMPTFALFMTIIAMSLRLISDEFLTNSTIWYLGFFVPLMIATLYLSTQPERYRLYQGFLVMTGIFSGLVVSSLYFRPSFTDMPSYFSMEVTWILGSWLLLGLRFRPALLVASIISIGHVLGIVALNYPLQVQVYEIAMLFLVNCIGAIGCYQLERTTRFSFSESLELEELTRELKALAEIDGLTGLNNRRTFDAFVDRLWRQCRREQQIMTIVLIDIDQFKAFNDRYGHQAGDNALIEVARAIEIFGNRPFDFVARYGGEEFVLALHGPLGGNEAKSEMVAAREYVERLKDALLNLKIPHEDSEAHEYLSASFGVALILPNSQRSLQGAIQMADEAMYQAKELGRNQVVVLQSGDTSFSTGKFRARNEVLA